MATPFAYSNYERLDLEIYRRLPFSDTSSIRFWAFSYSAGEPCGRSNQLIMYFMGIFLYCQCFSFYRLFLYNLIRVIFIAISCHIGVQSISIKVDYFWSNLQASSKGAKNEKLLLTHSHLCLLYHSSLYNIFILAFSE
jgi:hypothetical protein